MAKKKSRSNETNKSFDKMLKGFVDARLYPIKLKKAA